MTLIYNGGEPLEIKGYEVGDILIHRRYYLNDGQLSYDSTGWTISHIPTGFSIESLKPKRDWPLARLKEWAARAQADAEPAWAYLASLSFGQKPSPDFADLVRATQEAARNAI